MRPEDIYRDPGGGFGGGGGSLLIPLLAIVVAVVAGFYAYDHAKTAVDDFRSAEEITYGAPARVDLKQGQNVVIYEPNEGTDAIGEPPKDAFRRSLRFIGPDGPVDTEVYDSSVSLSLPGLDGYAMMTLDVPEDATYQVVLDRDVFEARPGTLQIGRNFLGDLIRAVVAGVVALLAGGVLLASLLSGRSKKTRLQQQAEKAGFELSTDEEIGELPTPPSEF